MKILKEATKSIPVREMEDGEIAIITEWPYSECINTIVQRYGYHLISLGKPLEQSWSGFFRAESSIESRPDNNKVRILPPGTQIEL